MEQLHDGDPKSIGQYTVVAQLGSGGMGRVYLCTSPGGRRVAVKVIRPELAEDAQFRARFRREVAAAQLVRSHVTAAVVDADTESRTPWLATLYLDGPTLSSKVEQSTLSEPELRRLAAALAEALQFIHGAGLVHRDLKPSHIILATDGPRVIDFGIARAVDATALTTTNLHIGSPPYMAPEQIRTDAVGPECDIFALGALLAYAATGRSPFGSGPTDVVLYRVLNEEPELDGVPPSLRALVAACLDKDPGQRPTPDQILQATVDHPARLIPTKAPPGQPTLLEPSQAPTWPVGVAATRVETQGAPQPQVVPAQNTSRFEEPHQGVREAQRRISAMEGTTQLDLANLDLRNSDFLILRPAIRNLTALKQLSLNDNQLTAVPEAIGNLTALTTLRLDGNQLTALPDAIGNLTALTQLDVSRNQLTAVPGMIGNLSALTYLALRENHLTALPEAIFNLTDLTYLSLRGNQLIAVPAGIGNLTALTSLDLADNRISAAPARIGNLTALTVLFLHNNQLTAVPDAIGNLTALTQLNLHYNQLTSLPASIGNLTALTQLYVFRNQLTSVPASIGNLTALTQLDLSQNRLSTVPDSIGNLTALNHLNLESNQLTSVPDSIGNLPAPKTWLSLGGNKLTALTELMLSKRPLF